MSKEIDTDKPFSDEDKRWLHERSQDYLIEENERRFKQSEAHEKGEPVKVEIPDLEVPPPPPNPRAVSGQTLVSGPVVSEEDAEESSKDAEENADRIAKLYEQEQKDREEADKRAKQAFDPKSASSQQKSDKKSEPDDDDVDIDDLTVEELKDNLRDFGESTSGSKSELQARLKKAVKESEK